MFLRKMRLHSRFHRPDVFHCVILPKKTCLESILENDKIFEVTIRLKPAQSIPSSNEIIIIINHVRKDVYIMQINYNIHLF